MWPKNSATIFTCGARVAVRFSIAGGNSVSASFDADTAAAWARAAGQFVDDIRRDYDLAAVHRWSVPLPSTAGELRVGIGYSLSGREAADTVHHWYELHGPRCAVLAGSGVPGTTNPARILLPTGP